MQVYIHDAEMKTTYVCDICEEADAKCEYRTKEETSVCSPTVALTRLHSKQTYQGSSQAGWTPLTITDGSMLAIIFCICSRCSAKCDRCVM